MGFWGAWAAQSVKHLTLDFGSDHDFMVCEFKTHIGLCAENAELAWDFLCPYLTHAVSFSLKINK